MAKKANWGEDPYLSGPYDWFRNSLIIKNVLKYKDSGDLLDFGCGSGHLIIRLARLGFRCVGVDVSHLTVTFLQKRIQREKLSKDIGVIESNQNYLRRTDKRFDVIVSGETLEHIKNDKEVVRGFFRVLKRGGICVVTVPAHTKRWDINDEYSKHYRRYDGVALEKLFLDSHFGVEKLVYVGFPLGYLWHKYIYLKVIDRKIKKNKIYSHDFLFSKILKSDVLKKLFSRVFYIDNLFNWTKKGNHLLLVARKK